MAREAAGARPAAAPAHGAGRDGWPGGALPAALAAAGALAYLLVQPASRDLAAALYRARLFSAHGLLLWDGGWYAGHHLLAYGVLYAPLAAALGARLVGALSAVAAAWAFSRLTARELGPAGRTGAIWFAVGITAALLTGRLPFELGIAAGLGALLALGAGAGFPRLVLGGVLAVACSLASPVAGLFCALAAAAWGLARAPARGRAAVLLAGTLAPLVALGLAFPEGGEEPFVASSFWPALALTVLFGAALPAHARVLRVGALLYAALLVGAFVLPTALGGNAARLGMLLAGPLIACARRERAALALALALPFGYWQLVAPVRDVTAVAGDQAVGAAYYRPLLGALNARARGAPVRLEIPFTSSHWEAYRVAPGFPLARGWERQVDVGDNPLFYRDRLTAERYRAWLGSLGVRYVALPDAPLDYSAKAERRLIEAGPSYLRPVWRDAHWRLFQVRPAPALATGPGELSAWDADGFSLLARAPGRLRVAERFTPYWSVLGGAGCVGPAPGGFTAVLATRPGPLRVGVRFALGRVRAHAWRCSHPRR